MLLHRVVRLLTLALFLLGSCAVTYAQLQEGGADLFTQTQTGTAEQKPRLDVHFVPTPPEVVAEMLKMAKVGPNDVVYDLGCGDGRIVIAAAKEHGARGIGVDLDPDRIKEARENAEKAGVTDKVKFIQGDLFKTDLSKASVVTLYLLSELNMKLRPKLWQELKPGSRVVSHAFSMGDWKPDQTADVNGRSVYLWVITGKVKTQAGATQSDKQ